MNIFCAYFENKTVYFVGPAWSGQGRVIALAPGEVISPANLLKNMENTNSLHIVSEDPAAALEAFLNQFKAVEAAGGVVENSAGEILVMRRRGWWDLPKGHVEAGETTLQAALREVEEETGLRGVLAGELITTTHHFYNTYGTWEMKRTWWYRMRYMGAEEPRPQTQEGITELCWMHGEPLWTAMAGSYSTIRNVFDAYIQQKDD